MNPKNELFFPSLVRRMYDLCQKWDKVQRPLLFFTLGYKVVLSSSSGVPEVGCVCQQFWSWLGQTGTCEPSLIKFSIVDGKGVYMSLPSLTQFVVQVNPFVRACWKWVDPPDPADHAGPNLITFAKEYFNDRQLPNQTQFEVKSQHGVFRTVISLKPDPLNIAEQTLTAQTIMTSDYPPTAFRSCDWGQSDLQPEVLIDIVAQVSTAVRTGANLHGIELHGPELHISEFYSKAADSIAADLPTVEEQALLRGAGRRTLCQLLDVVPVVQRVTLVALGQSARDQTELKAQARDMQAADIMKDLQALNSNIYLKWVQLRDRATQCLVDLREEWVDIRANWRLVHYYTRNFGFVCDGAESFTGVSMCASPSTIRLSSRGT